ncbi:DEAD-box ATP-dependent RNA helicase 5-like [Macadamia integrifolia]|uniref:DEAD-box ATP-dependent RNA helicase 5-like n=1 Tax=Macadamia integrifolia TaxID=60698 RepID=UPI001C4EC840|nr:DEAD-box ATP-dependent RNA helicase 5-like [Macadamia integrifolia]
MDAIFVISKNQVALTKPLLRNCFLNPKKRTSLQSPLPGILALVRFLAMGKKLNEALQLGEPETLTTEENHVTEEKKTKKTKKKDKKRKSKERKHGHFNEENPTPELLENGREEAKPKRKLEEALEPSEVNGRDIDSKKAKKKKGKKADESNSSKELDSNHVKASENKRDESVTNGSVTVSGNNTKDSKYAALSSFTEAKLPEEVLECCKKFSKPSPIQSHAWPFLLDGRDFIGIAATGSGKTLAFGVPALMHILGKEDKKKSKRTNPLCLVLSPTRELAQQIADVLCDAGMPCGARTVCLYGGTSKGPQISALKSGVDIVIGTPGRLKDLIEMGVCCLKEVSFVVSRTSSENIFADGYDGCHFLNF